MSDSYGYQESQRYAALAPVYYYLDTEVVFFYFFFWLGYKVILHRFDLVFFSGYNKGDIIHGN